MTTAYPDTNRAAPARRTEPVIARDAQVAESKGKMLLGLWQKASNDWIFNLSAELAYNLLMSIFPILVALLGIAGLILSQVSPGTEQSVMNGVANGLGGSSGPGHTVVSVVQSQLKRSAGITFLVGIVTSIWFGSRLFVTMEGNLSIVFRLRQRNLIRQNLMAIGMMLIYAVLVPFIALASALSTAVVHALFPSGNGGIGGFLIQIAGYVIDLFVGVLLFGAIYIVVPNRKVNLREIWKGTLVASVLLVVYEIIFPLYESHFLHPGNYGSIAGFAIVILVFFYYFAFILLLGAEVNSYAAGQRKTQGDLSAVMHEVQAHNTTRGAAGPTAGTPQEDMQHHKGAAAMATPERAVEHERKDHHTDVKPEEFAEAGEKGGPSAARPDTPESAARTREAEQRYGGKTKPTTPKSDTPEGRSGTADEERQPSAQAAMTYQATDGAVPTNASRPRTTTMTPEAERARRRTSQSLVMTTATALGSLGLYLLQRRRNRATA